MAELDEDFALGLMAELPDQTLEDIVANIREGADTPAAALGFSEGALNAIERMALGYYRARHFDKAAPIYAFLLQVHPSRASAWRGLGAVCHASKDYPSAVHCYRQAVANDADDMVARVFWGECLCQVGERENGLELLRHVIDTGTQNKDYLPYITRARAIVAADGGLPNRVVLMNEGRSLAADAKRLLAEEGFDPIDDGRLQFDENEALTVDDMLNNPELKKVLTELGQAVSDGNLTFAEAGGFTENEINGAYACACKYVEMGQVLEGVKIAGYLLFLDPYDARFSQLIGICLQRMRQYGLAEHYYRVSLTVDKDNPRTKVFLGECKIMGGHTDAGLELVREGLTGAEKNNGFADVGERAKVLLQQFGR